MRVSARAAAWRCRAGGEPWTGSARNSQVLPEDDLGLVHVVALHVGRTELEENRHHVRVFDALRDGLDTELVRLRDEASNSFLQHLVRRERLHERAVDLEI